MSHNVFIFYKWKHLLPLGMYFAYLLKYCEKKLVSISQLCKHKARFQSENACFNSQFKNTRLFSTIFSYINLDTRTEDVES